MLRTLGDIALTKCPRIPFIMSGFAAAAVLAAAGCTSIAPVFAPPSRVPSAAPVEVASQQFAGNAACKPCHRTEFAAHVTSRHNLTLHSLADPAASRIGPPV